MSFLRDAWYVAAWSSDVSRTMVARHILGEPILLYRKRDGEAVALSNRCPHRFAPLHKGKLVGDAVECPYHGLRFDCHGRCVLNPHPGGNGPIPAKAIVPSFALLERGSGLWIWMGESPADDAQLPDFGWLNDAAAQPQVRGQLAVDADFEWVVENYLEPSRWPLGQAARVHRRAPAHLELVSSYRVGDSDAPAINLKFALMLTPATEHSTVQYWSVVCDAPAQGFELDALRARVAQAFEREAALLQAQYRNMRKIHRPGELTCIF